MQRPETKRRLKWTISTALMTSILISVIAVGVPTSSNTAYSSSIEASPPAADRALRAADTSDPIRSLPSALASYFSFMPNVETPGDEGAVDANLQPKGEAGGWALSWIDRFNLGYVNAKKWVTCYPWYQPGTGCTNAGNNELQWYQPNGVSVSNGTLKLTARKQTVVGTNGKTYPYTSGMISSGPSMGKPSNYSYNYGFVEARMKMPKGRGLWPAFWLLPVDTSWPPEVDVAEFWGSKSSTMTMNVHWKNSAGTHQQSYSAFSNGVDYTTGWHTYGLSWAPDKLVWYIDGVARKTFTDPGGIPSKPMYMILNLAIDGNSAPDSATVFPAVAEVQYVRAWQKY